MACRKRMAKNNYNNKIMAKKEEYKTKKGGEDRVNNVKIQHVN